MPGRGEGEPRGAEHNMHAEEEEDSGKEGGTARARATWAESGVDVSKLKTTVRV